MKTILSIIFLSCALATNAQVGAYSLEEMKAGFFSQYVNHEPGPSLKAYDEVRFNDQFYTASGNILDSIYPFFYRHKLMKRILTADPSLRVVKNKVLPPSVYLWTYGKGKENGMLYWMEFADGNGLPEQVKMQKWLYEQFGTTVLNNCRLVPAKWFSGQLKVIESPRVYGNTVVSSSLYIVNVVNGEIEKTESAYEKVKGDSSSLIGDFKDLREGMSNASQFKDEKLLQEIALNFFARDVNRLCIVPREIRPNKDYRPEYSFLFFVDSALKTHLHVLAPSKLDAEDEKRISELSKVIEAQPAGVFARYWTLEGKKFSGMYVKGVILGGWNFIEYKYEE